ncbi:MAG TPA: WXG100 family type VII secretion target [Streptosporangiaceae bacterium]
MSEYTRAVFGALEQGQADFTQTYTQLQAEVSHLDFQLRSSLSAWDGRAQAAYYDAKLQWDNAMAHMATVLSQLGGVIGTANTHYQGAEAANTARWT